MNAVIPVRTPDPFAMWPDDYVCDRCCSVGPLTECDGDRLCRSCADKQAEQPEEDLLPLSHPVMRAALSDWNAKYGRDAYDRMLDRGNRQHNRQEKAR